MNLHNVWAIKMSNQNEKQFTEWYFTMEKIYPLLKMFGGHNTRPVDAPDDETTRDFVNVLKGRDNKLREAANRIYIYRGSHLLVL